MHNNVEPASSSTSPRPVAQFRATQENAPAPHYTAHLASSVTESQIPPPPAPEVTDSPLTSVQEQIKNAMIPLLLDIFALKDAAIQACNPSTRLQKQPELSAEAVKEKLVELKKNLQASMLWNETCLKQVCKALEEVDEFSKSSTKSFSASETPVDHKNWRSFSADLAKKLFRS